MTRLRDNEADFEGAVVGAAERLGLAPLFVEKDYWVTQVLRALHDQHAGAFVLKGGTSLSKGYELIERFSEDVDILIQPAKGDSAKSRERLLETITEHVAHTLDIDWLPAREPGRGKTPHRADVLSYPRVVRSAVAIPVEDRVAARALRRRRYTHARQDHRPVAKLRSGAQTHQRARTPAVTGTERRSLIRVAAGWVWRASVSTSFSDASSATWSGTGPSLP